MVLDVAHNGIRISRIQGLENELKQSHKALHEAETAKKSLEQELLTLPANEVQHVQNAERAATTE